MKNSEKFKNVFISIKQNDTYTQKKPLKERIRELIIKNEKTIKRYELLKSQCKNSQKKMEYLKIISKFRTRQISLHNKLHGLDLIMNSCLNNYRNNILDKKSKNDNANTNVNNTKGTFHKRINSSDYDNTLYTNNNLLVNNEKNKKNSKLGSTNDLNKLIPKPTRINFINQIKKNEIKKPNNNNKNLENCINAQNFLRLNTNNSNKYEISNSTSILESTNRQKKYEIYIKTNNKKDSIKNLNTKKNIIIINNINNYYGKIEQINIDNSRTKEHIVNNNYKEKLKNKFLKSNIIDEDEEIDMNINFEKKYKIYQNIKNKEFKSKPDLIFRKRMVSVKKNVVIEIYLSFTNKNKTYVAISEKSILGYNIKIFKFNKRKFVTRLKRHKNRIIAIKHFFNKLEMHDYLISGDSGFYINIWDISFKYSINQFLYSIKYDGEKIYYLMPVSIQQKDNDINNYLLIYDKNINLYDLDTGEYIKNISHRRLSDEKITNIIVWKNKNNNFDYIIKCSELKISIFNFLDPEIYFNLSDYSNNEDKNKYVTEGCINPGKKSEYLCIFSFSSYLLNIYLEIWDLYELNLNEKIILNRNLINDAYLLNIIPWNYKYIIFSDGNKNYLYVFDLELKKIVNKIEAKSTNDINHIYCKKIVDKVYNESLIVWKHNNYMSLFSINKFSVS